MKQVIAKVSRGNKVPLFTLSDKLAAFVRHELNTEAVKAKTGVIYITKRV